MRALMGVMAASAMLAGASAAQDKAEIARLQEECTGKIVFGEEFDDPLAKVAATYDTIKNLNDVRRSEDGEFRLQSYEPRYPDNCQDRARRLEIINVAMVVAPSGDVVSAEVLNSSNTCFHRTVLKAVKRWRFAESDAPYCEFTGFTFQLAVM